MGGNKNWHNWKKNRQGLHLGFLDKQDEATKLTDVKQGNLDLSVDKEQKNQKN